MTDQINPSSTDVELDEFDDAIDQSGRRRRMFLTGAGIAGAAAIVGKSGAVSAADGDNVFVGADVVGDTPTQLTNTNTAATTPGTPGGEAVVGIIAEAGNGSHAIKGVTNGLGHAVAGDIPASNTANTVGATWGRHAGNGAGAEGVNTATGVDIAGPANGVKGTVTDATNGSHAVLGKTNGGGHSVAGDTPADAPNTVAATWGRHAGQGAGIGGVNTAAASPLAGPARGVEGVVVNAANGAHAVFGATNGAGHSVAGDTPADAAGVDGVGPNTTAATWGRHGGVGAGIGGISASGYGGEFIGGKSHVRLIQNADAPAGPPSGDDHLLGEIYADGVGDLWYNSADGSNWVPLTKGGNVLFVDGQRAFDSRAGRIDTASSNLGSFSAEEIREIDLTEVTDFPAVASGALINLTVVSPDPGKRGYATVFNGDTADADRPDTSSINWGSTTEVVANSVTVRTSEAGTIKIFARESCDIIVDVVGYVA